MCVRLCFVLFATQSFAVTKLCQKFSLDSALPASLGTFTLEKWKDYF